MTIDLTKFTKGKNFLSTDFNFDDTADKISVKTDATSSVGQAIASSGLPDASTTVRGAVNTTAQSFAGPKDFKTGYSANITLADAATIAWDTSTGQVATFTFAGSNRTMGAPTNLQNGGFYALAVIQGAGSNTLTWNSVFKWAAGTAPTLSTAAGARDYFVFRSDGTNLYEQGASLGVA